MQDSTSNDSSQTVIISEPLIKQAPQSALTYIRTDVTNPRVFSSPLTTGTISSSRWSRLVDAGLMRTGLGHHLKPGLVDDIQEVLGINSKSVSRRQHLLLVVLLETKTEQKYKHALYSGHCSRLAFLCHVQCFSASIKTYKCVQECFTYNNVVGKYLVITYCWANFIFPISSAKSEFNSFCAISICGRKKPQKLD